jgi:hypothetical protein
MTVIKLVKVLILIFIKVKFATIVTLSLKIIMVGLFNWYDNYSFGTSTICHNFRIPKAYKPALPVLDHLWCFRIFIDISGCC